MTLELDARRRAMLDAMGIRLWARPQPQEVIAPMAPAPASVMARAPDPASALVPDVAEVNPRAVTAPRAVAVPAPVMSPVRPHATPSRKSQAPAATDLQPLPEGIPEMGWDALEAAVAACRACGLCTGRTQTVFGAGSHHADWMVVGEAPGANEDRLGEPFVGQAGKLLDNMLAAVGLSRTAELEGKHSADALAAARAAGKPLQRGVYIANVVKCRPPGNRNPEPVEVATCEHYLKRQIALLQPRIILAMGRFAVQALLQSNEPIGRLRGQVYRYAGVPVIATYHPAYLLRTPADKRKAWADLCLAMDTFAAAAMGADE